MRISLDEVRATAALARLALDEVEIPRLARELDAILAYMEELQSVDVSGVAPMTHAVALMAPLREDTLGAELAAEEALASAPARDGDLFQVPRVIAYDREG